MPTLRVLSETRIRYSANVNQELTKIQQLFLMLVSEKSKSPNTNQKVSER